MFSKDFKQFLEEEYREAHPSVFVRAKEVREEYRKWAEQNNKAPLNYVSFNRILDEKYYGIIDGRVQGMSHKSFRQEPLLVQTVEATEPEAEPIPAPAPAPTFDEALERAAKIAKLKLEFMEVEHIRHYLVRQTMEYLDKGTKIMEELKALNAHSLQ